MLRLILGIALALGALLVPVSAASAADTGVKQPVFLLCPHREQFSAWSIYLNVDKNDPSKVLSLGLEKLKKQNSKDSSYEAVVAAQSDPKVEREVIGTLDAKDFGTGSIDVEKNDALHVSVTPLDKGDLRLMVSMRISADGRFIIGGKDVDKRDVVLHYNKEKKTWGALATTLKDNEGNTIADPSHPVAISGIVFPVGAGAAGITRVAGVINGGELVILLDK